MYTGLNTLPAIKKPQGAEEIHAYTQDQSRQQNPSGKKRSWHAHRHNNQNSQTISLRALMRYLDKILADNTAQNQSQSSHPLDYKIQQEFEFGENPPTAPTHPEASYAASLYSSMADNTARRDSATLYNTSDTGFKEFPLSTTAPDIPRLKALLKALQSLLDHGYDYLTCESTGDFLDNIETAASNALNHG